MYKELETAKNRLVGTKQVLKALSADEIAVLYIANDADTGIKEKLLAAVCSQDIRIVYADAMKALGECCGIDVLAACAAIKKES